MLKPRSINIPGRNDSSQGEWPTLGKITSPNKGLNASIYEKFRFHARKQEIAAIGTYLDIHPPSLPSS